MSPLAITGRPFIYTRRVAGRVGFAVAGHGGPHAHARIIILFSIRVMHFSDPRWSLISSDRALRMQVYYIAGESSSSIIKYSERMIWCSVISEEAANCTSILSVKYGSGWVVLLHQITGATWEIVSFVPLPVLDRTSEQAAIMLVTTVSFIFLIRLFMVITE